MIGSAHARPDETLSASGLGVTAGGYVLAGGESSRMGQDKALVELGGRPLICWALEALAGARVEGAIAGARSSLGVYAPVIEDRSPGRGPLGGVVAALASSACELNVFLTVDMPLIPADLVLYLLRHASVTGRAVTIISVNGFAQTFPAVLRRESLPVLQAELEAGRAGCFAALRTAANSAGESISVLPAESLAQAGAAGQESGLPASLWFLNVNTPRELERVRRVVSRCSADDAAMR